MNLNKQLELKGRKKAAAAKRRKMKNKHEASRSLAMEKSGKGKLNRSHQADDPYMVREPKGVRVKDLEKLVGPHKPKRSSFAIDQRGSINSQAVGRRKQLQKSS